MGSLQVFLQRIGDLRASSLGIVHHLVESVAIVIVLQLSHGFHRFVEIVVDDGKAVPTVLKGFPAWESEILGVVHEIHTALQDVGTTHRRETVEVESDDQIGIIGQQRRQLVVHHLVIVVQLVKLCEFEYEVLVLIII